MSNNGGKEATTQPPNQTGMVKRTRQPLFEKDLMTAGYDIVSSLPTAVFKDEQSLNDACLYLGWLSMHDLQAEINVALWKINGTMAIGGRARKDAVQAHGLLYYPDDASKDDKKWLSIMQQRMKETQEDNKDKLDKVY